MSKKKSYELHPAVLLILPALAYLQFFIGGGALIPLECLAFAVLGSIIGLRAIRSRKKQGLPKGMLSIGKYRDREGDETPIVLKDGMAWAVAAIALSIVGLLYGILQVVTNLGKPV